MIHIWTADICEGDMWSSQRISNLSNWNEEAWKKIRASTGFEPMTSAIPVRCSTNWAMKPHIGSEVNCEFLFSRERNEMTCSIWNDSYVNCGYMWRWYVIFAVNFQFIFHWLLHLIYILLKVFSSIAAAVFKIDQFEFRNFTPHDIKIAARRLSRMLQNNALSYNF